MSESDVIDRMLRQYRQKFDDSAVVQILLRIEEEMYRRREFFGSYESPGLDPIFADVIERYKGDLIASLYGLNRSLEVLCRIRRASA